MSESVLYIFVSLIVTITLQGGRVRVSHKETKIQRSYLLKATNLVSKPRLKPEFEPKAHICPFYHLIAFPWVSCIHKPDKVDRFVLIATGHFPQLHTILCCMYRSRKYNFFFQLQRKRVLISYHRLLFIIHI